MAIRYIKNFRHSERSLSFYIVDIPHPIIYSSYLERSRLTFMAPPLCLCLSQWVLWTIDEPTPVITESFSCRERPITTRILSRRVTSIVIAHLATSFLPQFALDDWALQSSIMHPHHDYLSDSRELLMYLLAMEFSTSEKPVWR